jgi:proline racemase
MAALHAKERPAVGQGYVNASPFGPTLTGQGWICGLSSYTLDPRDPFPRGYTIGEMR